MRLKILLDNVSILLAEFIPGESSFIAGERMCELVKVVFDFELIIIHFLLRRPENSSDKNWYSVLCALHA